MLDKIIAYSIRHKLIIGLLTIGLIITGIFQLSRLSIDAVPDITNNQVQIITRAPSMGTTDIERLVTFPLEQACSNIPELKEMRSFSRFGLSLITLVFEDKTDIYWARQQIAERMQLVQSQIPEDAEPPFLAPVTSGLGEIYQYVVKPKKGYEDDYSLSDLRTIQDWIVRRELLRVEGVADVGSFGGHLKQYQIAIIPEELKGYNLTLDDIFNALDKNNQNAGGAYIEKHSSAIFIRTEGLLKSKEDIAQLPVKYSDAGTPLTLGQVSEISESHALRFGAMTYNGETEVAGAVVMMVKGSNSSAVIKNIKEKVAQIQEMLPQGVEVVPFLDRTKMVNNAISTVEKNLLEGALIVLFVLILFLGNIRAGALVASVIPLSMLFAVILMNTFGVSGNLMSLGALDFGLIVDGAVIIVEAVLHTISHSKHFRQHDASFTQNEMDGLVHKSSSRMMNAAVFGQVIILLVYLPIFSLEGIEGKMFKPMALTVAFALLGAFILSLTYVPMMSALILNTKSINKQSFSDRLMAVVERRYQNLLSWSLQKPRAILLAILILFGTAVYTLSKMGGEFIPTLEEGDFAVETWVMTGSNLEVSVDACLKAQKVLKKQFPEVIMVVGKTGSSEIPIDPMPIEASDLMIILKDKSEWTSAKTFDELASKMSEALKVIPGVQFGFQYPVQMRFNELLSGARQDVVCKIYGDNIDTLSKYAQKLTAIASSVDGTTDLYTESVKGLPELVIKYRWEDLSRYGLDVSDVNRIVRASYSGESAGWIYEGERRFEMILKVREDFRANIDNIGQLLIPTSDGTQIPLYLLADIQQISGPNQIQREDGKRRIVVGFNVQGRDVQSIVDDLQKGVEKELMLPSGYTIHYGGSFENLRAAKERLTLVVPLALATIFVMLYLAFKSVKLSILIYSAIPLSAIGGIFALFIRGLPFSISAGIGFIALFGVAVLNGIVLMAEFRRLNEEGYNNPIRIVLMGTKVRLRPVLMTATVASLGFIPMALSHGSGAEVQRPLATVVIGGLLVATILTLIVLPILYVMFFNLKIRFPKFGKATALALWMLFAYEANAQQSLSLEQALDSAISNNLQHRSELLFSDYQKKLIDANRIFPALEVGFNYGQINSIYLDNGFNLSQQLPFPTTLKAAKQLSTEEWKKSLSIISQNEIQLKQTVASTYEYLQFLNARLELLSTADSIADQNVMLSKRRLEAGETDIMEKITLENQRNIFRQQMMILQNDIELATLQLQLLTNTSQPYTVEQEEYLIHDNPLILPELENHPLLETQMSEYQIGEANKKLIKAGRLPDLIVGYNNQTIRGTGADNLVYDKKRFQSVQFGLSIPVSIGSSKVQLEAIQLKQSATLQQADAVKQMLSNKLQSFMTLYHMQVENERKFRQEALENVGILRETATRQLTSGEINALEWALLMQQCLLTETSYLDIVHQARQTRLQIQFFNPNQN